MISTIICPECHKEVSIDEALKHQLEEQARLSVDEEHKKILGEEKKKAVDDALRNAKEDSDKLVSETHKLALEQAKKAADDEYSVELKFLKEQLGKNDVKMEEYRIHELELRKEKTKIDEEKKDLELTVQRRVDEEKKKAEQIATERVSNDYKLKLLEKEQLIGSMNKKIEELKQKSNLTSSQLQGDALEIDVQRVLTETFPDDVIMEVEKFKNGSDIIQNVKSGLGRDCGKILWECKTTNTFKPDYVKKLKADLLTIEASFGIIVTRTLPKEAINGMTKIDGIWVISQALVEYMGMILRESLISVAKIKFQLKNKDGKGDKLISYFNGDIFAQQIQEQADVLKLMREQIGKERGAFARIWADRDNQINRQINSIAKVLSSIQQHVGLTMPKLEGFELLSIEDGDGEKEQ